MFQSDYFPNNVFNEKGELDEDFYINQSEGGSLEDLLRQAREINPKVSIVDGINPKVSAVEEINPKVSAVEDVEFNDLVQENTPMNAFTSQFQGHGTYTSFSGADTKVTISFQGGTPISIGEAQTVTYSLHRPMTPVYNLGSPKPAGYVRGPRTVAGSIIFTVFDRNVLLQALYNAYSQAEADCLNREYLTDEIPPFDIHITFLNEHGQSAYLVIHDVYITSEGQVMSIEDMITENTIQYLATDLTLMRPGIVARR